MHLITGIVLSAVASRLMEKKGTPRKANVGSSQLTVAHAVSGRVRMYSGKLKDPHAAKALEDQLKRVEGIESVTANPVTGSLLITHDVRAIDQPLLITAVRKLVGAGVTEDPPKRSAIMQEAQLLAKALDYAIIEKSGRLLDINTLITGTFFALGIRELLRQRSLGSPPPISLLFWAYKLSGLDKAT